MPFWTQLKSPVCSVIKLCVQQNMILKPWCLWCYNDVNPALCDTPEKFNKYLLKITFRSSVQRVSRVFSSHLWWADPGNTVRSTEGFDVVGEPVQRSASVPQLSKRRVLQRSLTVGESACRCPGGVTGKETVKTAKMKRTVQQVSLLSFSPTVCLILRREFCSRLRWYFEWGFQPVLWICFIRVSESET